MTSSGHSGNLRFVWHGIAGVEILGERSSLIIDPYMTSAACRPAYICISHPDYDHCHEPTLKRLTANPEFRTILAPEACFKRSSLDLLDVEGPHSDLGFVEPAKRVAMRPSIEKVRSPHSEGPGKVVLGDFSIEAVDSSEQRSVEKTDDGTGVRFVGENRYPSLGFLVTHLPTKIGLYHPGDLHEVFDAHACLRGRVDVMFFPVTKLRGLELTVVKTIRPGAVVPIHYRPDHGFYPIPLEVDERTIVAVNPQVGDARGGVTLEAYSRDLRKLIAGHWFPTPSAPALAELEALAAEFGALGTRLKIVEAGAEVSVEANPRNDPDSPAYSRSPCRRVPSDSRGALTWSGASGVAIDVGNRRLWIDPYRIGEDGRADYVLVTREDWDHCDEAAISGLVKGAGFKKIGAPAACLNASRLDSPSGQAPRDLSFVPPQKLAVLSPVAGGPDRRSHRLSEPLEFGPFSVTPVETSTGAPVEWLDRSRRLRSGANVSWPDTGGVFISAEEFRPIGLLVSLPSGVTVYHPSDLQQVFDWHGLLRGRVDYLLLPLPSMTGAELTLVESVRPKFVVPIHYRSGVEKFDRRRFDAVDLQKGVPAAGASLVSFREQSRILRNSGWFPSPSFPMQRIETLRDGFKKLGADWLVLDVGQEIEL